MYNMYVDLHCPLVEYYKQTIKQQKKNYDRSFLNFLLTCAAPMQHHTKLVNTQFNLVQRSLQCMWGSNLYYYIIMYVHYVLCVRGAPNQFHVSVIANHPNPPSSTDIHTTNIHICAHAIHHYRLPIFLQLHP